MAFVFWSEHVYNLQLSWKCAEKSKLQDFYGYFFRATDMFTWTPPSRCFSTYKTWFLKIHPTFFHPTTFKSSEKETHYICHCPIFFWKTEPNFCCLPSSPQKNMNLVVKLGSLLVHYSPFLKYSSIYTKLTTSILHFCFQNELFQLNFEFLALKKGGMWTFLCIKSVVFQICLFPSFLWAIFLPQS